MSSKEEKIEDLRNQLEHHLRSVGWDDHTIQVVVPGILSSIEGGFIDTEDPHWYDDIKNNLSVENPPELDEVARDLLSLINKELNNK